MRTALLALLLAVPGSTWAQLSYPEKLFHESMAHYKKKHYKEAFKGFMGVVVEDPDFPKAKEYMERSAKLMKEAERQSAEEERESLIADIKQLQRDQPNARRWRRHFKEALRLANDPTGVCLSMARYKDALEAYPVEQGDIELFRAAKARFFEVYWASHWRYDEDAKEGSAKTLIHDAEAERRVHQDVEALEASIESQLLAKKRAQTARESAGDR